MNAAAAATSQLWLYTKHLSVCGLRRDVQIVQCTYISNICGCVSSLRLFFPSFTHSTALFSLSFVLDKYVCVSDAHIIFMLAAYIREPSSHVPHATISYIYITLVASPNVLCIWLICIAYCNRYPHIAKHVLFITFLHMHINSHNNGLYYIGRCANAFVMLFASSSFVYGNVSLSLCRRCEYFYAHLSAHIHANHSFFVYCHLCNLHLYYARAKSKSLNI